MNLRSLTAAIIIVVALGLGAYDVAPFMTDVDDDTISEVLRDWGQVVRAVPFAAGVLVGHWWWQRWERRWSHATCLTILAALAAAVSVIPIPSIAAAGIGIISGAVVWPLRRTGDHDGEETAEEEGHEE